MPSLLAQSKQWHLFLPLLLSAHFLPTQSELSSDTARLQESARRAFQTQSSTVGGLMSSRYQVPDRKGKHFAGFLVLSKLWNCEAPVENLETSLKKTWGVKAFLSIWAFITFWANKSERFFV